MATMIFSKDSEEIPAFEAQALGLSYVQHPNSLKVIVEEEEKVLKGLRFDKEDILNLFKPGVTHLFLMFAMSPIDPARMTIVAGGVVDPDDNGGMLDKSLLYDYCEPCPNKCPNNL